MEPDFAVAMMEATVKIEQVLPSGQRAVGTGFLIGDTGPDGQPRVMLITAEHVLEGMTQRSVRVGFRVLNASQAWSFEPADLSIRNRDGQPLWQGHTSRDVAAIVVQVPADLARRAIPLHYLADPNAVSHDTVRPGTELMTLGFPRGLAANAAGFAILRTGRLASYPVGPTEGAPTFLMDFNVFSGNSGGPVFVDRQGDTSVAGAGREGAAFVAGILTQQVEVDHEALGIGIVTHARFVRETIALMDRGQPRRPVIASKPSVQSPGRPLDALHTQR